MDYFRLSQFVLACPRRPSLALACSRLFLLALACPRLLFVCSRLLSLALACSRLLSFVISYYHLLCTLGARMYGVDVFHLHEAHTSAAILNVDATSPMAD